MNPPPPVTVFSKQVKRTKEEGLVCIPEPFVDSSSSSSQELTSDTYDASLQSGFQWKPLSLLLTSHCNTKPPWDHRSCACSSSFFQSIQSFPLYTFPRSSNFFSYKLFPPFSGINCFCLTVDGWQKKIILAICHPSSIKRVLAISTFISKLSRPYSCRKRYSTSERHWLQQKKKPYHFNPN